VFRIFKAEFLQWHNWFCAIVNQDIYHTGHLSLKNHKVCMLFSLSQIKV